MTSDLRGEGGLWSRRSFFRNAAIAGCGLVTTRTEASEITPDNPGHFDSNAGPGYPPANPR